MNPTILSGSSLNTWIECPKEWKYAYVLRREMPPSYKMALGIAAHEAVEYAFNYAKISHELPPLGLWMDAFEESWAKATKDSRPKNNRPAESAEAHRQSGREVVLFYAKEIAPTIDVVAFEEPIAITINGHVWTGTIDLIDRMPDGRMRLRDHKFTARKPDGTARYLRPMIGYYLAARERWDIGEIALDYIVRGHPPTYTKLLIEPTEQEILGFATEIEEAAAAIKRGDFPPLGRTTGACRWCRYRPICPDARTRR